MKKKTNKFSVDEMRELCRKHGVQIIEMKAVGHFRLVGGLAVDFWPKGGSAWIYGARKSWKPNTILEVIEVANLKIVPEGTEWLNKNKITKEVARYLNVEHCCPICRKKVGRDSLPSMTDRMIDLREFLNQKEDRINTKTYSGE